MARLKLAESRKLLHMADMKGKVAVLTGGTSGIGQVAAEAIAGMGTRLILVARDRFYSGAGDLVACQPYRTPLEIFPVRHVDCRGFARPTP